MVGGGELTEYSKSMQQMFDIVLQEYCKRFQSVFNEYSKSIQSVERVERLFKQCVKSYEASMLKSVQRVFNE